jgi:hypothetical protein
MKRLLRPVLVFLVVWGLLALLALGIRISPLCPLWICAAGFTLAVEALLFLYHYESGAVTQQRARWIVGLRLFSAALILWMLIEPTWVRKVIPKRQRQVVVVMDDSASMHLQDDGEKSTRIDIAEKALQSAGVVAKLSETMKVRTIRAARSVIQGDETTPDGWGDATDLTAALSHVLEQVPPDELGGVVLVSDGRHNRPERVEDAARRFGILDAPIGVLAMGSAEAPRDASILSVVAPEAVHLGDRMRVTAKVKLDGYKGSKVKVMLSRGKEMIEEREIAVPQDHHREDVRFVHVPKEDGLGDYRVEIKALDGERFADNNNWEFETSITDARTNVLLVDSYPRWEFRYLRNLFYGRDKSVHLQYVLFHPDQILDQPAPNMVASASRPFGEAQAAQLPTSEEEWRKFDVIILGDIEAEKIDSNTWQIISRCVNERGALLVFIAGPRSMPHALVSNEARDLVPAEMVWGERNYFTTKDKEFQWSLTAEGQNHVVTQQANGEKTSAQMWSGFPSISWRHPITGVKEGAEILLCGAAAASKQGTGSSGDLTKALDELARKRQQEIDSALLVTRQTGKGKVALLLSDRTWRLREGAGDVFHHRFWGNLVLWGAGPTLRAGGKQVRLGTDQLTYTPDDKVIVTARLRDEKMAPIEKAELQAEVLKDGQVISTTAMSAMSGSNGFFEVALPKIAHAGRYEVRLRGSQAEKAMTADGVKEVVTGFRIVGSRGPVELAETTQNLPLLTTIASLSGGKVMTVKGLSEMPALFLVNKSQKEEIKESSLWDNAWVLLLLALALSTEWVLRRSGGLP